MSNQNCLLCSIISLEKPEKEKEKEAHRIIKYHLSDQGPSYTRNLKKFHINRNLIFLFLCNCVVLLKNTRKIVPLQNAIYVLLWQIAVQYSSAMEDPLKEVPLKKEGVGWRQRQQNHQRRHWHRRGQGQSRSRSQRSRQTQRQPHWQTFQANI